MHGKGEGDSTRTHIPLISLHSTAKKNILTYQVKLTPHLLMYLSLMYEEEIPEESEYETQSCMACLLHADFEELQTEADDVASVQEKLRGTR